VITCSFRKDRHFSVQKILGIIQTTSRFDSDIYIVNKGISYNLKSVLGVMNLFFTAASGQVFSIKAEGPDAEEAVQALTKQIENTKT
jgi:phosphotransferase system HPr (HPr) family protein